MAAAALARDAFKSLIKAYERVQVELHGKYSLERLFRLHAYQHTYTFWSCLLVAFATPLPCLATIVVADLIPLNAPSDGLAKSHVFWVRAFVVVLFITLTLLEQSRRFVPTLPCSTGFLLAMSLLISLAAVVCTQWLAYIKVVTVQMSLTLVYPAFIFVFIRLHGWEQTAFALLLPLMKLVAKNALSASFDNRLEDLKPEGVIFNVDVFHALYMSCCMQSSSSIITTALLMVLDFLHAWSSLNDISHRLKNIQRLECRLEGNAGMSGEGTVESANEDLSRIEKAMFYAHYDTSIRTSSAIRSTSGANHREQLASVVPTAIPSPPVKSLNGRDVPPTCSEPLTGAATFPLIGQRLMASRRTRRRTEPTILFGELSTRKRKRLERLTDTERVLYVSSLLQVLHIVEFILFIEFVEVIIPVVYCVYLTAMFHLPNRVFYPQLATMDPDSLLATIGNVLAYAALEFVSFVSLCVAVRRKVQISPMHQLAFVLHSQWGLVQSKMVLWVVFVVQVSLTHFGYDYSFQFAWLKATP